MRKLGISLLFQIGATGGMKMWIKLVALLCSCAATVLTREIFDNGEYVMNNYGMDDSARDKYRSNDFLMAGDQEDDYLAIDDNPEVLMEGMFADTVNIDPVNKKPSPYYEDGEYVMNNYGVDDSPREKYRSNEFLMTGDQEAIYKVFYDIPEGMVGKWWFVKNIGPNFATGRVILPTGEIASEWTLSRQRIVSSDNQDVFPSSEGWYKFPKYLEHDDWGYLRLTKDGTLQLELFCNRCSTTFHGLNNYECSAIGTKQNILFLGTFENRPHQLFHGGVKSDNQNVQTCYEEAISKGTNYFGVSYWGRKCFANDPNAGQTYDKNPIYAFTPIGNDESTSVYKILEGKTTNVVFNPKMIGRWDLGKYGEIVLNADGMITNMEMFFKTDMLSASDNQEQFPTKDGWFKVVGIRSWQYVRLINGQLEYHVFRDDIKVCNREYKGLRHYCYNFTGTKQDWEQVGCFNDDDTDRVFKGGRTPPTYQAVRNCYLAALKNNVEYYGIGDNGYCYAMDPDAGKTYFKYGETTGCHGRGAAEKLNVYRIKGRTFHPKTTTPPVVDEYPCKDKRLANCASYGATNCNTDPNLIVRCQKYCGHCGKGVCKDVREASYCGKITNCESLWVKMSCRRTCKACAEGDTQVITPPSLLVATTRRRKVRSTTSPVVDNYRCEDSKGTNCASYGKTNCNIDPNIIARCQKYCGHCGKGVCKDVRDASYCGKITNCANKSYRVKMACRKTCNACAEGDI